MMVGKLLRHLSRQTRLCKIGERRQTREPPSRPLPNDTMRTAKDLRGLASGDSFPESSRGQLESAWLLLGVYSRERLADGGGKEGGGLCLYLEYESSRCRQPCHHGEFFLESVFHKDVGAAASIVLYIYKNHKPSFSASQPCR